MHYAIAFQSQLNPFLISSSRKKSLKHQLICIEQGLALIKLGKLEYAVEAGQCFWLPFDTLTSITYLPNTQLNTITVSSRVSANFAKQAGYVIPSELLAALLNRLKQLTDQREAQLDLLKVVQSELTTLKPELKQSPLTQKITQWQQGKNGQLLNELKLALRIREAHKQLQSGQKRLAVIEALFDGNENLFNKLEQTILGRELNAN